MEVLFFIFSLSTWKPSRTWLLALQKCGKCEWADQFHFMQAFWLLCLQLYQNMFLILHSPSTCNSADFHIFTGLYNHCHTQFAAFSTPEEEAVVLINSHPYPNPCLPLASIHLLSVSGLASAAISCEWVMWYMVICDRLLWPKSIMLLVTAFRMKGKRNLSIFDFWPNSLNCIFWQFRHSC